MRLSLLQSSHCENNFAAIEMRRRLQWKVVFRWVIIGLVFVFLCLQVNTASSLELFHLLPVTLCRMVPSGTLQKVFGTL